ncbi:hypothetical protein NYE70_08440 [Paenibacillus sp. FSL R5-0407]|uniref:hypothetical protein n=1 Tax=Paenibacillus sp. FSL R5-0407 TaxID=2975320 RepID=UPI0030F725A5
MSRSADYTISGFLYQFNKTLLEILQANEDAEITVEGIIEDIEVSDQDDLKAIQCKYHEGQEQFNLSTIYKPILQMIEHHFDNNASNIEYRLFTHFPSELTGSHRTITKEEIVTILDSNNQKLQKYTQKLKGKVDIDLFLTKFVFEFGPTLDELIDSVYTSFEQNGIAPDDIETLIYPNAIQVISELSIKHNESDRKITKKILLQHLSKIKKTAVTRWTRALKSFEQIVKQRRKQLHTNLSKNSRLRYFYINECELEDFQECIVTFISEYIEKYHFKDLHDKTPLFLLDCSVDSYNDIRIRLYKKGIKFNDGFITDQYFDKNKLFIEPIRSKIGKSVQIEFSIRLLRYNSNEDLLNENKCQDFFLFGDKDLIDLDQRDINIEKIGLNNINQIKFVLGMSDTYE